MVCPKCKAKIGVIGHQLILDTGVVDYRRCVMCGYWEPNLQYNQSPHLNYRKKRIM